MQSLVEPVVSQLPRYERDVLLNIIRMLTSPINARWLPVFVFVLLRLGILKRLWWWRLRLARMLNVRRRIVERRDEADAILESLTTGAVLSKAVPLPGRDGLPRESKVLNADVLGPVLTMAGFRLKDLNTEFVLHAGEAFQNGQPVFQSRDGDYVLSSVAVGAESCKWIVRRADSYNESKVNKNVKSIYDKGTCAISPEGVELSAVPSLAWQEYQDDHWETVKEAGVQLYAKAAFPAFLHILPPEAKKELGYEESYFQPAEACWNAWCLLFMGIQVAETLMLQQASSKSVTTAVRMGMSRTRWLVIVTCVAYYVYKMIAQWKDRRSRGRAMSSDILGSESSQAEARLSALCITVQVLVWMTWVVLVMALLGVNVGRVLLVPSIGALLLGFVGRDIISNILSSLVIYLTQPFAQGDWITLETGQDGWVQEVGIFYTKVCQWDKRPLYVPNFRLIQMLVQNNSRMTQRRCLFDVKLRLQDVPKIPAIVSDIQNMMCEHEHIDNVQHRLVRWRAIGDYYALIWVSCYTTPTAEGIRLKHFISVEQSLLERISTIVYKQGADFASSLQRYATGAAQTAPTEALVQAAVGVVQAAAGGGVPSLSDAEEEAERQFRDHEAQCLRSEKVAELQQSREDVLQRREQRLVEKERQVQKLTEEVRARQQDLEEQVRREEEEELKMKAVIAEAAPADQMLLSDKGKEEEEAQSGEEEARAGDGAWDGVRATDRERRAPREPAPPAWKEQPPPEAKLEPTDPPIAVKDMGD